MTKKLQNRFPGPFDIDVNVRNINTDESSRLISQAMNIPDWKYHDLPNHGVTPSRSVEITIDSLRMITKLKQLHNKVWK